MIYGAIKEDDKTCENTYLKNLFSSIENKQKDYNWLITNCEVYSSIPSYKALFSKEYVWLTGEQLTDIAFSENTNWVWAVFSGFPTDVSMQEALKYQLPYADGYTGFWKNPLTLQHPLSIIEIVPWDGVLTLILSKDKYIVEMYRKANPCSRNLEDYNND